MYNLNKYLANILKTYVKHENNNAKNSTTFSNYIRNVPIEADEIMVSFDVTSLYTNIPIIDTLNIIKDYFHSDDQFARKTAIPQDKFLDLVNLVLTKRPDDGRSISRNVASLNILVHDMINLVYYEH